MDLASLFLSALLLLVVGGLILYPLLRHAGDDGERRSSTVETLTAEREAILAALRELDFDHATGKIADEDYTGQRTVLVARGAAVLRQLDALAPAAPSEDLDAALEAAVRAARARRTLARAPACPRCRRPYQPHDRFCAGCGTELPQPAEAQA